MSYTLCASLFYRNPHKKNPHQRNPHRESSEKIPDKPSLVTAPFLKSSLISHRHSDIDCLSTPCPKCSKRSIVQRSPNTFDCLNCNFHKRLPALSASHRLAAPRSKPGRAKPGRAKPGRFKPRGGARRLETDGLGSYELGNAEIEGNELDNGLIGHGSLSRFLETSRSPLYITPNHNIAPDDIPAETDAAQPVFFAVIAVIIGILIL